VIAVQGLHFSYTDQDHAPPTLQDINLSIPKAGYVAILGPNGSGKSTLGRCLNGLLQPTSGSVTVDGLDTADAEHTWEIHRLVGMIFQNPDNQLVSTTVERELAFGLENIGIEPAEIQSRVAESLDRFDLGHIKLHAPHRLSGGQKQRLAIAAVMAMRPRYLICDEPTALLDPRGRSEVIEMITAMHRDYGISVVHITQFPEEAEGADQVIIIQDGRIAVQSVPAETIADAGCLQTYGLSVPVAVHVADKVRTKGVPLTSGIVSAEQLVRAVKQWPPSSKSAAQETATVAVEPAPDAMAELKQVSFTYSTHAKAAAAALSDVSIRIERGTFTALIGPNGSGKSTLMQHLNALIQSDQGEVLIDGVSLKAKQTDLVIIRQQVGLVFQFPEAQLFEETVFQDVAFGPTNLGIMGEALRDTVNEALRDVRLDPDVFSTRTPFSLSGGEKRRVAIAGILAMKPLFLVLDEPTAGLDAVGIAQVEAILKRFQAAGGTVLLVSHDMDLVGRMAERVIVLDEGRIVGDGPPQEVFAENEIMETTGLHCPTLSYVLSELHELGYPVSAWNFDIDLAAESIAAAIDLN
jgi:energy-coupling factor transport system ATP-binding protein